MSSFVVAPVRGGERARGVAKIVEAKVGQVRTARAAGIHTRDRKLPRSSGFPFADVKT